MGKMQTEDLLTIQRLKRRRFFNGQNPNPSPE